MAAKSRRGEAEARRSTAGQGKGKSRRSGKSARPGSAGKRAGQSPDIEGMSESIGRETETAMKSARDLWSRAFAVPPQVMGWSATAPGQQLDQIERALSQFWRVGGGEWGEYAHVLMRTNVEIASLVGRRTRAMFEHPIRLSMCRTPQQLLESQAEFIEGMMRDYRTMSEHLIDYWTGAASRERR